MIFPNKSVIKYMSHNKIYGNWKINFSEELFFQLCNDLKKGFAQGLCSSTPILLKWARRQMHKAPTKDEEPFRAFELKRVEYTAKVEVARKSMYKYRNARIFLKFLFFFPCKYWNSAENGVGIFKMYTYIILSFPAHALSHKLANATETV